MYPRKNNTLYGFEAEKKTFLEAMHCNRLHHAWLITGMPSIGKATFAYHMAKFVLSNSAPSVNYELCFDPHSATVKRIEALSHPDLQVIDAELLDDEFRKTPNIGVDEIRALNRLARLTTTESRYRVVLIDGIEYMNQNAANCLLKLLEEPSANTLFFLICNSLARVLPTIRSRCITMKIANFSLETFSKVMRLLNNTLDPNQLQELYTLSLGNIKFAQQLQTSGSELFSAIKDLATSWKLENLLSFIENTTLSTETWKVIVALVTKTLYQQLKEKALIDISQIEKDLAKLDALNVFINQGEIYNLDKQHMLMQFRRICL